MIRNLLKIASELVAQEEEENFAQQIMGLRKNMRGLLRNRTKTLKMLGIRKPIRPTTTIEEVVSILKQLSVQKGKAAKSSIKPSDFVRGLMTLRSKRKKRLKNFGMKESIKPSMKVQDFIKDVIMPIIQVSVKEEAQKEEQEEAKKEQGQVDIGQDAIPQGGFFEPVENSLPTVASQPANTEEDLYDQAEEAQEQMLDWLNRGKGMDKKLGLKNVPFDTEEFKKPGRLLLIAPPKGKDRAREKVMSKMDGDWSKLTDVVRASVAVDSIDEIPKVLDELRKSGMELAKKPRDRFSNPTSAGYRDILMNVKYPNGHVGELQIHLKPILLAKDAGHKLYEDVRSIEANAKLDGRYKLTDEEQATVDKANKQMRNLYDRAWKKAIGRTAGMSKKGIKQTEYFMFEGNPSKVVRNQFPLVLIGKKFKIFRSFEKFNREAEPITQACYLKELKKRTT